MKNKTQIRHRRNIVKVLLFLLIVIFIIGFSALARKAFCPLDDIWLTILISTLEATGLFITIVFAIKQLIESKELARATFIMELNKAFVENSDYVNLYNELHACREIDDNCNHKADDGGECSRCNISLDISVISNYLTFFETIHILNREHVITFDIIDDLFAYRFFLAVHSKFVQQKKLLKQPFNFKNVFILEKEWLEYRSNKNQPGTPDPIDIVNIRQLKTVVPSELYGKLIDNK